MGTKRSTTQGQHRFAEIPGPSVQRSTFDRSCGAKTTFDAGYLIPIFVDECLPGDTFSMQSSLFGRIATLLQPIMDNCYLDTHFFAVPMRLLWDNWQKFMGEQENPGDSIDYLIPITAAPPEGYANQSMQDYMGIPTLVPDIEHSALPLRAYNLIWNEWFRDQNMQDSVPVPKGDGPDSSADYTLLRRGKRHDYFTSCLPFAQKGDPVQLSFGGTAPVSILPIPGGGPTFTQGTNEAPLKMTSGNLATTWDSASIGATGPVSWGNTINLFGNADLSQAEAATINEIRTAFQIQRMLERDARGGTRYTEIVRSHFGVISPDARLQRPEYLGGGSQPLFVKAVANTFGAGPDPQASLAAYGTVSSIGNGFRKSFTEHCIIIGLVSLRADLNYQQGLERMWSRRTKFDFYWPSLAHLGEQAVLQGEIFADGTDNDELVFGYQERFAEYRYKPSRITGKMRSNDPQSLDIWHLAQDFANPPVLSSEFIEEDPPVDRVIAVQTEPHMVLDAYFKYRCARPMPVYSVPGLVDHF